MLKLSSRNTFVIGDIHGAHRALVQCLDRANFNYAKDKLICLGDICDGWPETDKCFDELLRIKNLVLLLGNHDEYLLKWAHSENFSADWIKKEGKNTVAVYKNGVNPEHIELLTTARSYYKLRKKVFVHASLVPHKDLKDHTLDELIWSRDLVQNAMDCERSDEKSKLTEYDEIFVGHTPTVRYYRTKPFKVCEVWLMDTGAGWNGKLSMMNIYTKEVFQSDNVNELYPGHKGRFE